MLIHTDMDQLYNHARYVTHHALYMLRISKTSIAIKMIIYLSSTAEDVLYIQQIYYTVLHETGHASRGNDSSGAGKKVTFPYA